MHIWAGIWRGQLYKFVGIILQFVNSQSYKISQWIYSHHTFSTVGVAGWNTKSKGRCSYSKSLNAFLKSFHMSVGIEIWLSRNKFRAHIRRSVVLKKSYSFKNLRISTEKKKNTNSYVRRKEIRPKKFTKSTLYAVTVTNLHSYICACIIHTVF